MACCIHLLSTSRRLQRLFSNTGGTNVSKIISGTYLKAPCRFFSGFSTGNSSIKKKILFRIGSGILLASGFSYIYMKSPDRVVQCDHPHLHIKQINNIPPEGKITRDEAITLARDLIERKKVSIKYRSHNSVITTITKYYDGICSKEGAHLDLFLVFIKEYLSKYPPKIT